MAIKLCFVYREEQLQKLKPDRNTIFLPLTRNIEELLKEKKLSLINNRSLGLSNIREKSKKMFVECIEKFQRILGKEGIIKGVPILSVSSGEIVNEYPVIEIFQTIQLLLKTIKKYDIKEMISFDDNGVFRDTLVEICKKNKIKLILKGGKENAYKKLPFIKKILKRLIIFLKSLIKQPLFFDKKTTFLTISYEANQVKTIEGVVKLLNKNKKNVKVICFDRALSGETKSSLKKRDMDFIDYERYNSIFSTIYEFYDELRFRGIYYKNEEEFGNIDYEGVSIYNCIKEILDFYFVRRAHVAEVVRHIKTIDRILSKEKPKILLILGETSIMRRILNILGKQKGIKTVYLQHAMFVSDPFIKKQERTDYAIVNSSFYKEQLIKSGFESNKIFVAGQTRYDIFYHLKKEHKLKEKTRKKLHAKNKKIILITTQPQQYRKILVDKVLRACKSLKDIKIIIKMHPGELHDKTIYHDVIKKYKMGEQASIFTDYEINTHELLITADLLITESSTTALEAMIFDVPVILVDNSKEKLSIDYTEFGAATRVSNVLTLKEKIKEIMYDGKFNKIGMQKFVKKYIYKIDGKATERTAKFLMKLLKN